MVAPKGNRNARHAREWKDTVKYVLNTYETSAIKRGQALREIAIRLFEMALNGDMRAIKEIGNRLDGKPARAVMEDDCDPIQAEITVSYVDADHGKPR